MLQLELQTKEENPFYLDRFDKSIRDQFVKNNIISKPEIGIDDVFDLEEFDKHASSLDKSNFLKILRFKSAKNVDAGEYAISWLLDGNPVGQSQNKTDVSLKNGKTVSVKHVDVFKSKIKFGRVASSKSYKDLMSLWSFYVAFLNGADVGLNPTKILRKQIETTSFSSSPAIIAFLEKADLSLFETTDLEDIQNFLSKIKMYCSPLNDEIKKLINNIVAECLKDAVDYMVIIHSNSHHIKVIDVKKDVNDFYQKYFASLEGQEMYMTVESHIDFIKEKLML